MPLIALGRAAVQALMRLHADKVDTANGHPLVLLEKVQCRCALSAGREQDAMAFAIWMTMVSPAKRTPEAV